MHERETERELVKLNPPLDALVLEVSGRALSWPDVPRQTGDNYATDWFEQASLSSTQQLSMQQLTTCCGLKRGPKFSEPAHILPLERLLRSGFNPSHLNALVDPLQSLSILKYFPHMTTSDWMEWTSWRWLKRQVAHRAIVDVSWHETTLVQGSRCHI